VNIQMNETNPTFTWPDAWLFQAIALAGGQNKFVEFVGIIGAGDYINHAVFTLEEVLENVPKLLAAEFIEIASAKIKLSGKTAAWYKKEVNIFKSSHKQQAIIKEFLKNNPPPFEIKLSSIGFTQEDYDHALAQYQKKMQ
jgi:predicted DNA-binding transcriptional regulator AlpA